MRMAEEDQVSFARDMTMDFWPGTRGRFDPVWREVLRTLRLGQEVDLCGRRRL